MISSFITQGQEDWWKKQQKQQKQQQQQPQQTPYDYSSFVQQPVQQQQPIDFSTILGSATPTGQTEQSYSPEWNNWLMNTQNQATQVSYTPFIGSRGRFL